MRPGILDMAEITANEGDVEEHLAQAFELFEEHFGVPKMLEVRKPHDDLMCAFSLLSSHLCSAVADFLVVTGPRSHDREARQEINHDVHRCHQSCLREGRGSAGSR